VKSKKIDGNRKKDDEKRTPHEYFPWSPIPLMEKREIKRKYNIKKTSEKGEYNDANSL